MSEEEKEERIILVILLSILTIILIPIIFLIIAVDKVYAADYQDLVPSSETVNAKRTDNVNTTSVSCTGTQIGDCFLNFSTTSNHQFVISFNASYYASASNQIQFTYTLGLRMGNEHLQTFLNWNNVKVYYYTDNGQQVKDVSGDCTTTGSSWGRDYHENLLPMREEQWTLTTTCNEINPGANARYIRIVTPFPTGVSFIRQFYFYSKSLTLKRITGTITDTDRLENAISSSTQNIINNNNSNTTILTDKMNEIINGENVTFNPSTPDSSKEQQLETMEGNLNSYLTDDTDLAALSIDIDPNSNTTIWGIFNRIITGNTIVYGTFITILVFGIIKTLFAR